MSDTWYRPPPGTPKSQIPTPALLIDQRILEANITLMGQFFKNNTAKLRPHLKTHKSPLLAKKQIEAGAIGMTCAKLGEAEVLVEAGSYLFKDTKYRQLGLPFRCAFTLLATVISMPFPSRAIIYAGMKVLTTDNGLPEVIAPTGVTLSALHEEHGILEVDPAWIQLQVGERVELVPSRICTTVNLHDRYFALRNGMLEAIWPITGRGKSQ